MPEYLRALVVILALTLPVFWLAKAPICEYAIAEADFKRRRNLWLAITVIAFVANSFWVYAVITAALLAISGARDSSRLGLYLFLLFAVPPLSVTTRPEVGVTFTPATSLSEFDTATRGTASPL